MADQHGGEGVRGRRRRGIETEFCSIRVLYVTALSGNSIAAASGGGRVPRGSWGRRWGSKRKGEGREEGFQLPVTSLTPDPPREHPGSRGTVPKHRAASRHLDTCHQECECRREERVCLGRIPRRRRRPLSRGEGFPAPTLRTETHTRGTRARSLPRRRRASPPPLALRAAASGPWLRRERALLAGRVHAGLYAASLGARMKNVWAEGPRQTTFT